MTNNGHDPLPGLPGGPQEQRPQIPIAAVTRIGTFLWDVAVDPENGARILIITDIAGHQVQYPFTPDNANAMARKMMGPSVAAPPRLAG